MTTFLQTIDKAWPGSSKIAAYADSVASGSAPGYSWLTTILVIAVLVYCIYFFHQIVLASSLSMSTFFGSSNKLQSLCENQTSLSSVNATSIICLPAMAMLVYARGWTSLGVLYVFAAIAVYLALRVFLFRFTAWYKDSRGVFEIIRNSGRVTLVVASLLSIPAFLVPLLFGSATDGFARIYLTAVFAVCYAMYCTRACKYLLEAGFSIFFCFLYLCALELLPAGLLISAIISL
ncbi:MAG: DUF4271 domain-containing protein [Bacteroidales bacterium]|nr:DUF4271 domain-containing protein [Bacteroidales bacterium]